MSLSSTTASARLLPEDPVAIAQKLMAKGRAREAAVLLQESIDANSGGLLLRLTLQKALLASGDAQGALVLARETALNNPAVALAALALGEALQALGHVPTAIGEFQRALRLDPHLDAARIAQGSAWQDAGEPEKALETWRSVRDESALHSLAERVVEAESACLQPRCDSRFVRHLFDQFSADYDARMLNQLHYRAPQILRELAEFLGVASENRRNIVDLGCGTGLMGEAVHDWANRLDGVDLSPAMVAKARDRGIYDQLFIADICTWLTEPGRAYDLMFAADSLVYLGDLAPLLVGVARRLSACGHFLFTVERKCGDGFELGPKRRWRHSESAIRTEACRAGLRIAGMMCCEPRTEAGVPVEGLAVALARENGA